MAVYKYLESINISESKNINHHACQIFSETLIQTLGGCRRTRSELEMIPRIKCNPVGAECSDQDGLVCFEKMSELLINGFTCPKQEFKVLKVRERETEAGVK